MAERKTTKAAAGTDKPGAAADEPQQSSNASADEASEATQAAPLEAPPARPSRLGNPDSSTNFVAAAAALRSPSGSTHIRLHDEDDNDVDPEGLFEFPPPESPSMLARVNERVFQQFTYPGATTPTSQLLYAQGAMVPVEQALWVRDALRTVADAPAPTPPTSAQ